MPPGAPTMGARRRRASTPGATNEEARRKAPPPGETAQRRARARGAAAPGPGRSAPRGPTPRGPTPPRGSSRDRRGATRGGGGARRDGARRRGRIVVGRRRAVVGFKRARDRARLRRRDGDPGRGGGIAREGVDPRRLPRRRVELRGSRGRVRALGRVALHAGARLKVRGRGTAARCVVSAEDTTPADRKFLVRPTTRAATGRENRLLRSRRQNPSAAPPALVSRARGASAAKPPRWRRGTKSAATRSGRRSPTTRSTPG